MPRAVGDEERAARAGMGIIDRHGGTIVPEGFTADQVRTLFMDKSGNALRMQDMLSFE